MYLKAKGIMSVTYSQIAQKNSNYMYIICCIYILYIREREGMIEQMLIFGKSE